MTNIDFSPFAVVHICFPLQQFLCFCTSTQTQRNAWAWSVPRPTPSPKTTGRQSRSSLVDAVTPYCLAPYVRRSLGWSNRWGQRENSKFLHPGFMLCFWIAGPIVLFPRVSQGTVASFLIGLILLVLSVCWFDPCSCPQARAACWRLSVLAGRSSALSVARTAIKPGSYVTGRTCAGTEQHWGETDRAEERRRMDVCEEVWFCFCRIQAVWRGHRVRKWYRGYRQTHPPSHPVLRERYFQTKVLCV